MFYNERNILATFLGIPMALHLLIDGYNLMGCSGDHYGLTPDTLEEAREQLMEKLARYRGLKQARITLVFDGGKGGYPTRRQERKRGMEIIFSKLGEEADHVIKGLLHEGGKPFVVVTSDNDILNFAEERGFTTIRSREFESKMEMAAYMGDEGIGKEDEAESRGISTRKKGNPRKLSKKERKHRSILKKI